MITIAQYEKPQSFFVEVHIADIHFGAIDPVITYEILQRQFLQPISEMKVIDIISVNGDLFDHKFMVSSDAVLYASYFIQQLVDICKSKNATLLLISGTGSHDSDQMKLFYPYMRLEGVDVRIIMNMSFEYIKGKRVLCIPELYNRGAEYYEQYLFYSGLYDACYMHGCFKGAIRGKDKRELDSKREPVFAEEDFSDPSYHLPHFYELYAQVAEGDDKEHDIY